MKATRNLGLAILTIAFLVLNPLGACVSMPSATHPGHPCCPKTAALQLACATLGCMCVNAPSLTAAAIDSVNEGLLIAAIVTSAATDVLLTPETPKSTSVSVLHSPEHRYVTFHQFLI